MQHDLYFDSDDAQTTGDDPATGASQTVPEIVIDPDGEILTSAIEHVRSSTHPPILLPGDRIERHLISHRIARGAMGEVYQAVQETMDREVAFKILLPELADEMPELADQFLREACAAARLVHPNIVAVHASGLSDYDGMSLHWFSMELVRGPNLRVILERDGHLEATVVRRIMRALADALQHADAQGMVHRDIKPDNVMLTPDGTVKLADFGLVNWDSFDDAHPLQGRWVGTPRYISPEQIRREPGDIRSDFYSLGATAYHLLMGAPPFTADSREDLLRAHLNETPPDPRADLQGPAVQLMTLILRLMAKDPKCRPADAPALIKALDTLPQTTEAGAQAAPRRRLRRRIRRRR